ncbi:MAG: hypothetical protein P8173_18355, partial [Gammaproteobacteria bacterium]
GTTFLSPFAPLSSNFDNAVSTGRWYFDTFNWQTRTIPEPPTLLLFSGELAWFLGLGKRLSKKRLAK